MHACESTATIFRRPIFRTGIKALILPGLPSTSPRSQTVPPPCACPYKHACRRDPTAPRCRAPSSSMQYMNTTLLANPSSYIMCSKTMPTGGMTSKGPSSSDPGDPHLGFPPEHSEQGSANCKDDAFDKGKDAMTPPSSTSVFTGSHASPIPTLTGTL